MKALRAALAVVVARVLWETGGRLFAKLYDLSRSHLEPVKCKRCTPKRWIIGIDRAHTHLHEVHQTEMDAEKEMAKAEQKIMLESMGLIRPSDD